jgi:CTP synthase (UTP-ammonia lyase)
MALAPDGVEVRWVATDSPEASRVARFDGLWVLPGTPYRDEDSVLGAIRFARESAEDAGVEAFELLGHSFYLATLLQPQVGSSESGELHPVLAALCQHSFAPG